MNEQISFLKLKAFSDAANIILNGAIALARETQCKNVQTAHLLVIAVRKDKSAEKFIENLKTSKIRLEDAYNRLVEEGMYGYVEELPRYTNAYLSGDLMELIQQISTDSCERPATPLDLLNYIREYMCVDESIRTLLVEAGVSPFDIDNVRKSVSIPKSLEGHVEDLCASDIVKNAKLCNIDEYVDKAFEVLSRKTKANPCFIGPAGVGKTSIVYGMVQKMNNGSAPEQFKDTHVVYVNSAMITSGTRYRGDFEERMKTLIKWAKENDVILFLDEMHAFINAGKSSEETSETAGTMIKKDLSDGTIKIIGTTTLKDYHKYIENDTAFKRRIQAIDVKEPSVPNAIQMIKNTISGYEDYHNVKIPKSIIELAVKLSNRYMKDQYLPDKAYTIIDDACAKTKLSGKSEVTEDTILEVVSSTTGINVNKLTDSETKNILCLEDTLERRVIGQDDAVKKVSKSIRRAKAGTREENKPVSSFLFVGPTGVGKTELCKVLSEEVTPGRDSFIKVDMSEFSERFSTSKLIGSAPGYVGYGEGGQLTEKVKHNPNSLILFDEIEKADPSVFNIFLQLLDEGRMTDASGETVDFTNCIVVMTSNAGYGADSLTKKTLGFSSSSTEEDDEDRKDKIVRQALEQTFRPELLNRFDDIVLFNKLSKENCKGITELLLDKLSDRLNNNKNIDITFGADLVEMVTDTGYSDKYGARNLKRKIQDTVEDELSNYILDGTICSGEHYIVNYDKDNKKITVK